MARLPLIQSNINDSSIIIKFSESISIIDITLNETCLLEGGTVAVRCNVQGFPRPYIEFRLNDEVIYPGMTEFYNFAVEYYDQVRATDE